MTDLLELLGRFRLVPVVVIESVASVAPLADALVDGGLPCVEVTLRTPAALEAMQALAERADVLVGAGSVRTAEQVDDAVDAGARFVVSPGFSDRVVGRGRDRGVPVLPGVATATEIMRALDAGVEVVKLFPVALLGGPAGVRSLAAPFPTVRFVPTGGIGPADLVEYLRIPAVVAVGGSWMVAPDLLHRDRYDEIRRLTQEAVLTAREARP
jgi:2-dehydro-3-deoxyphosphogluconate aldolase / (4S)-4-hydroxy-2-oxoglutarate aldolase